MRTIDAAMLTELTADIIRPRILIELEMKTATIRYWTGDLDYTWNGYSWSSNSLFQAISPLAEKNGRPEGFKIDLAGNTTTIISYFISEVARGKIGRVYFALLDSNQNIINTPISWVGRLDSCEMRDGAEKATITLNYEDYLVRMKESKALRYNQETQKAFYPSDLGFEFAEQMEDWAGYWGKSKKTDKKKDRNK